MNPMAGSALQDARRAREEQAVEVVEDHEGGTRSEMASRSRRRRSDAAPGVDSGVSNGGGAIFGNPKRGGPGLRPGRLNGWCRESRRQGQEGRARRCGSSFEPPRRRSSQVIPPSPGGQGHGGQRQSQHAATTSGSPCCGRSGTRARSRSRSRHERASAGRRPRWEPHHGERLPPAEVGRGTIPPLGVGTGTLKTSEPHTRPGPPRGGPEVRSGSNLCRDPARRCNHC